MATCPDCNEEIKGNPAFHAKKHASAVAVAERPRSQRGQRLRGDRVLTPLDQIRMAPTGGTSAHAYYLRPDGATIRDALVISPNGGVPDIEDQRLRARYGANASHYRDLARAKGFEFLGEKLTPDGVRKLVNTLAKNREDELLFCQEEIEDCDQVIANSDLPQIRDQAKRRKVQFERRINTMLAPFDADALLEELEEIARAQMLANVDPNVMKVMRAMIGEVNERMAKAISRFTQGKQSGGIVTGVGDDASMGAAPRGQKSRGNSGADFSGSDFIDAD